MSTVDERIVERFQLKAFVESCLVLEEGVAGVRDIDMGLMMGTGMIPGPFVRADLRGLDEVLAALEAAEDEWGEHFEPPVILRRLVAQGRLGAEVRAGLLPVSAARAGLRDGAGEARHARRRRAIAVARQPAGELARARPSSRGSSGPGSDLQGAARGRWCWRRRTRRCSAPAPTSRRSRSGTSTPGASTWAGSTRWAASGSARRSSPSPPSTAWRSAAAARSRWPATCGSPAARRPSASPRSTSGSSRASAARSGCRGSSGRRRRWR